MNAGWLKTLYPVVPLAFFVAALNACGTGQPDFQGEDPSLFAPADADDVALDQPANEGMGPGLSLDDEFDLGPQLSRCPSLQTAYFVDCDGDGYALATAQEYCFRGLPPSVPVTSSCPAGSTRAKWVRVKGGDCDETNAAIHKGVAETCNSVDDNCNGKIDEYLGVDYFADLDGDGRPGTKRTACGSVPPGGGVSSSDCNDGDATVWVTQRFYKDADRDGAGGTVAYNICATAPSATACGTRPCVSNNTDCNDADATVQSLLNLYTDNDRDGYGVGTPGQACVATPSTGFAARGGDCDDTRISVHPGAAEDCRTTFDDNCDGQTAVAGIGESCWAGVGACRRAGLNQCLNDGSAGCNAVAGQPVEEVCNNGADDDCDGAMDEGCVYVDPYPDPCGGPLRATNPDCGGGLVW